MTADPHAPSVLDRLTRDARAVAASVTGVMGLTPDDLVSAGWLAFAAAAARGVGVAGCHVRARHAMTDEVRAWIGTPWDHRTGEKRVALVPLTPDLSAPSSPPDTPRTRLPRRVMRAVRQLPRREQLALHAWTVRGWDHATIAAYLKISEGNSGYLRSRALQRLRGAVGAPCDRPRRPPLNAAG